MKIRFRLLANENEPVTRQRGIYVYRRLQERGIDAGALVDGETADVIVCQYDGWDLDKLRPRCDYLVLDVADAHFMPHHPCAPWFVQKVTQYADWVLTCSTWMKHNMERFFDPCCVSYFPEAVDPKYMAVKRKPDGDGTIMWMGMQDNAQFFSAIDHVFERLHREGVEFKVVFIHPDNNSGAAFNGSNKKLVESKNYPTKHVTWTLDNVIEWMGRSDIALCPTLQNGWCRCKAANKAASFAAAGLPVVATDIPSYREFIESGKSGYLCWSPDDWYEPLHKLLTDEAHRKQVAKLGCAASRERYSIDAVCDRFMHAIEMMVI